MSEDVFSRLWDDKWAAFASGVISTETVMVDIIAADRLGYTVDLSRLFEIWLSHR